MDQILVDIIGQFLHIIFVNGPVFSLIYDLRLPVYRFDAPAEFRLGVSSVQRLKNNHIRVKKLFHDHGTHIAQIHFIGRRVYVARV